MKISYKSKLSIEEKTDFALNRADRINEEIESDFEELILNIESKMEDVENVFSEEEEQTEKYELSLEKLMSRLMSKERKIEEQKSELLSLKSLLFLVIKLTKEKEKKRQSELREIYEDLKELWADRENTY